MKNKNNFGEKKIVIIIIIIMIKIKIRETSIEFGRINKRKMFQKQDDIEKTIKILQEQTANIDATDCQNVWSELEKKRRKLETIIEYHSPVANPIYLALASI